MHRKVKFPA